MIHGTSTTDHSALGCFWGFNLQKRAIEMINRIDDVQWFTFKKDGISYIIIYHHILSYIIYHLYKDLPKFIYGNIIIYHINHINHINHIPYIYTPYMIHKYPGFRCRGAEWKKRSRTGMGPRAPWMVALPRENNDRQMITYT